jgi:hypothetical protein
MTSKDVWTKTDEHHGTVTVRRHFKNGEFQVADIFNGGWRATRVKTERGIANAVARLRRVEES